MIGRRIDVDEIPSYSQGGVIRQMIEVINDYVYDADAQIGVAVMYFSDKPPPQANYYNYYHATDEWEIL